MISRETENEVIKMLGQYMVDNPQKFSVKYMDDLMQDRKYSIIIEAVKKVNELES